ncbi:MAG: cyclic nucleotide-binding domain-containing protein [Anaerolineae bacterium]|jgi:hypothetical protein|nr:cyclic nucleotide-binding domain-containing protein [Anaerolineae bacterium]
MIDPQIVARLRALPVFAQMPPYMHERLAQIAEVRRYEAGAVVFRQWEVARGFYLLLSGQGQLVQQASNGTQRVLAVVVPGQYFNEAALQQELVEQASFVMAQSSIVLHIARAAYQTMPTTPPKLVPQRPAAAQPVPQPPPAQPAPPARPAPIVAPVNVPRPAAPVAQPTPPQPAPQPNPARTPATPSVPVRTAAPQPPDPAQYPWLNPGERIKLMTRRHWWKMARMMWVPAVLGVLGLLAVLLVPNAALRWVVLGMTVLIPGGLLLYYYVDWRNDWLVITDQRVLRVERDILRFRVQTQEVGLTSIQAVKAALPPVDPMARLLRYGDVQINTAGAAGNVSMDKIPNPERIKDFVFRQAEVARRLAGLSPDLPGGGGDDDIDAFGETNTDPGRPAERVGFLATKFLNTRGETVYRHHWTVWLRGVFLPLLVVGVGGVMVVFGAALPFLQGLGSLAAVAGVFVVLVGGLWFWLADWDWRNDLYIVSDTVVTLLRRRPLYLQYNEDQVLLSRVHNIEAVTSGLLRSLLDYGDVRLLLLGDETPKEFRDVPAPLRVREEISRRQREAAEREQEEEDRRNYENILQRMQERGQVPANASQQTTQAASPLVNPSTQPYTPPIPRRKV